MKGPPTRRESTQAPNHRALVAEIACVEQRIDSGRRRMRADRVALGEALRARLISPLALLTAMSAGYVFGRYAPQPVTGLGDASIAPHDRSVLQRLLLAAAVVQSWRPLLSALASWFELPASSPSASSEPGKSPRADASEVH